MAKSGGPAPGNLYTRRGGPDAEMRQVKLDQDELRQIKELYEGVMSHACHGLFFKEGSVLGAPMAEAALKDRAHYYERAAQELKERGWVTEVTFSETEVAVKGSIEVSPSDIPTCHRLRGILREFYERFKGGRVKCTEEMCASTGQPECRFHVEEL
jgi:predicted hydrocarbon binding protein